MGDPTDRLTPKIKGARLTVQKGLMERWEEQGSEKMKAGFEETVDAAVSALLCDVGVVEEPEGEYHLGKLAMDRKNFDEALERFQKAVQLKQDFPEAHNGIAVCLALSEEYDDAIEWATKLTEKWPTYAPAWYNLAWWHAVDKEEPSLARPYYEKGPGTRHAAFRKDRGAPGEIAESALRLPGIPGARAASGERLESHTTAT